MPASTGSRLAWSVAVAALGVVGANAWVDLRLPALLHEDSIEMYLELVRRVEACPAPAQVRVVVFGNSHALAGLRPPQLAVAWGLPPEAVFSLALPSGYPREMTRLARAFLPRFPNARLAVANLDATLINTNAVAMPRGRFLTRHDPAGRWAEARATEPEPLDQLVSAASTPFPLSDFAPQLREAAQAAPRATLRALFGGAPTPLPGSQPAAIAALPFAWGYPPPWPIFPHTPQYWQYKRLPSQGYTQARSDTAHLSACVPQAFADLAAWDEALHAAGLGTLYVETPLDPQLSRAMRVVAPAGLARYAAARASFLAAPARRWVPVTGSYAGHDFEDLDHLAEGGSRRLAAEVAAACAP